MNIRRSFTRAYNLRKKSIKKSKREYSLSYSVPEIDKP